VGNQLTRGTKMKQYAITALVAVVAVMVAKRIPVVQGYL
jgi:hypothetical protein